MAISNAKACDFVVFTQTDIKIICIGCDQKFIEAELSNLTSFYEKSFKECLKERFVIRRYDVVFSHDVLVLYNIYVYARTERGRNI